MDQILYIESEGHYVNIHTKDGETHKVRKTMKEFLEILDLHDFARVHRSYIINLRYIYKIFEDRVVIHHTTDVIPLGNIYKDDFNNKFIGYRERKYVL